MTLGKWIGLLAFILSCYILWQIRQLLLLAFAAVVLATALNRLARYLQNLPRWKIDRKWSVFISISCLVLFFIIFVLLVVPPFVNEFQLLTERVPEGINKGIERLNDWADDLQRRFSGELGQQILERVNVDDLIAQLQSLANQIAEGAGSFLSNTVGFVGNTVVVFLSFLLTIVLAAMMLVEPLAYRQAFVRLFPSFYRRRVEKILDRCDVALGGWLVGILFNMLVIAVLSWIGLSILGVRLALAHAVLAGLLTFIPNVGPGLSVIPPMAIALLDDPWKSVAVLILYIGVQQLESNFLTPLVMAQQVSLLPAVTLLAQALFATFFGFLGLFLALPLAVVAQVWIQEVLIKDILDQWKVSPRTTKFPEPPDPVAELPANTQSILAASEIAQPPPSESASASVEVAPSESKDSEGMGDSPPKSDRG